MFQSQIDFHSKSVGFNPSEALVEIKRRDGEHNIRIEDILAKIEEVGDELALVLIGGVNYYTGQVFDMKTITEAGHKQGAYVGWDLAHAAGNIELHLNEWKVDFAAWCSYKYMNSGPGNASGCFVHEMHHNDSELPRFAGWWGHNKERRFKMEPNFDPVRGAEGWQISNLPILSLAPYLASVDMFAEVGMTKLITKRNLITAYLEFILKEIDNELEADRRKLRQYDTPVADLEAYLNRKKAKGVYTQGKTTKKELYNMAIQEKGGHFANNLIQYVLKTYGLYAPVGGGNEPDAKIGI